MNEDRLKKQIEEINNRAAAGQTLKIKLTNKNDEAHLGINSDGAWRIKKSIGSEDEAAPAMAESDPTNDAPQNNDFNLDLTRFASITETQIVEKIKAVPAQSQTIGALDSGDELPRVVLTRNEAGQVWVLVEKCSYQTVGHTVAAPVGYETDLASIPRLFWSIMAPEELSLAAPLFHDLIYRCAGSLPEASLNPFDGKIFKRKEVDDLFLELMTKANIPRWKRTAAYLAVRGFAGFAWRNHN